MKPERVGLRSSLDFKHAIVREFFECGWKVIGHFLALLDAARLFEQIESLVLLCCVGELNDETKVGEIVGHG